MDKTSDVSQPAAAADLHAVVNVGGITQWQLGEIITVWERGDKKVDILRIGGGEGKGDQK